MDNWFSNDIIKYIFYAFVYIIIPILLFLISAFFMSKGMKKRSKVFSNIAFLYLVIMVILYFI